MTATSENTRAQIEEKAIKAKTAAKSLRLTTEKDKNEALATLAEHLKQNMSYILTENAKDIEAGRKKAMIQPTSTACRSMKTGYWILPMDCWKSRNWMIRSEKRYQAGRSTTG